VVPSAPDRPILDLVNEITRTAEQRGALRWLARQLAWEQTLDELRAGDPSTPEARAA
jgi:hypothetical protein